MVQQKQRARCPRKESVLNYTPMKMSVLAEQGAQAGMGQGKGKTIKIENTVRSFRSRKTRPDWYNKQFERAQTETSLKHYDEAAKLFSELSLMRPENHIVWIRLAYCLRMDGRVSEARSVLEYAAKVNPRNGSIWKKIADMEKNDGNYESARILYRKAALLDPEFPDTYDAWGRLERRQGNLRIARALFTRGLRSAPDSHRLWHGLGVVQDLAGEGRAALGALRRAVRLAPGGVAAQHPRCGVALALCEWRLGRRGPAQARLRRLARRHPEDTEVWYTLGRAAEAEGDLERARLAYARVRGRGADALAALATWAALENDAGDREACARVWSTAAARHPGDLGARVRWARAEARCGRPALAREVLRAAVARWPRAPWPRQALGELELDQGDAAAARAAFYEGARACQGEAAALPQLAPLFLSWAVGEWAAAAGAAAGAGAAEAARARRCLGWAARLATPEQAWFVWLWWAKFEAWDGHPHRARNYLARALERGAGPREPAAWDLWHRLEVAQGGDPQAVAASLRKLRDAGNIFFWRSETDHPLQRTFARRPQLFDARYDLKPAPQRRRRGREEERTPPPPRSPPPPRPGAAEEEEGAGAARAREIAGGGGW